MYDEGGAFSRNPARQLKENGKIEIGEMKLLNRGDARAGWSVCLHSTPSIQVQIPLNSTVLFC